MMSPARPILIAALLAAPVPASAEAPATTAESVVASFYDALEAGDEAELRQALAPGWSLTQSVTGRDPLGPSEAIARTAAFDLSIESAAVAGDMVAVQLHVQDAAGNAYQVVHLHEIGPDGRILRSWRTQVLDETPVP